MLLHHEETFQSQEDLGFKTPFDRDISAAGELQYICQRDGESLNIVEASW